MCAILATVSGRVVFSKLTELNILVLYCLRLFRKESFLFFKMAKILLVGSDPSISEMYLKVLESNGFDSITETTAKDGLDRLSDEFFPACIVFLSREETLWFLIKLRSFRSVKVSSIPVLAVADEASENMIEYFEKGATRVIPRFPTSGDKIVTELKNILNIPRMNP